MQIYWRSMSLVGRTAFVLTWGVAGCGLAYLSADHGDASTSTASDASNGDASSGDGDASSGDAPDGSPCNGSFRETWSRADGPGWPAAWTTLDKPGLTFGIASDRGEVRWAGVDTGIAVALVKGIAARTIDVRAALRSSSNGPRMMILARADERGENAYAAVVRFDTEMVALGHIVWGDEQTEDVGPGPKIGDLAFVHFRVEEQGAGTMLSLNVWSQGAPEPTGFRFTRIDNARGDAHGGAGIRFDLSENRTVEVDDFEVTYQCQ
jgi:hypothetical protein